jgi:hypothetical protein
MVEHGLPLPSLNHKRFVDLIPYPSALGELTLCESVFAVAGSAAKNELIYLRGSMPTFDVTQPS